MAKISANRGDIAEGIMGAALTAKFLKRKLGQDASNMPKIVEKDIDDVLKNFFRGSSFKKFVRDVPPPIDIPEGVPYGRETETTINIVRELLYRDQVVFKLTLPKGAMDFLSVQTNRNDVRDIYRRAILYANTDFTFIREANRLATNAKNDKILVNADGVSNQNETKVDIGLFANGRKIGNQISLKTDKGRQFDQVRGFGIDAFDKLFVTNLSILVDGNVKNEVNSFINKFNVTDAFSFKTRTSKDATGSSWAGLLKKAAAIYYKGAESVIKKQIKSISFRRKLAATIRYGATRGDQDIQLVKFKSGIGYSERTFGPEFETAMENADLSVSSNFTDNPTVKINSGGKLLVQFRARVDARSTAKGYTLFMRNILEAGTGLFEL